MESELFLKYEIHQVSVFVWQLALKIQTTSKFNQGQQEQLLYPFIFVQNSMTPPSSGTIRLERLQKLKSLNHAFH